MMQLQNRDEYLRGAICQHVFTNGIGNLLIIPVEISSEQRMLIDKYYDLDIDQDYDGYENFYDGCYSEMLQEQINRLMVLGKKYFLKHPQHWVRVAKPIRVSEDAVKQYLTIHKLMEGAEQK